MARIGGRSLWLAWPAGLFCLAAVVGMGALAVPGIPMAVSFAGDTLRAATSTSVIEAETAEPASDCRHLYTQPLWSSLVWAPDALLSQRHTPALSTPEAVAVAGAKVVVTCHWRGVGDAFIETTVSTLSPVGATAVQAALSAQGFTCVTDVDTVQCERTGAGVREIHDLRGDRWVSSTLHGWEPTDYAVIVASRAFGE